MGGNLPEETWLQAVLEEGCKEAGAEDKFFFPLQQREILELFQKTETSLLQPPPPPPFFVKCGLIERGNADGWV